MQRQRGCLPLKRKVTFAVLPKQLTLDAKTVIMGSERIGRIERRGDGRTCEISIPSPSNKRPGPDRRTYETKQREVLESDANLIELDLLRGGTRVLPYPDLAAAVDDLRCDYLILLNRSAQRQDLWMDYTLYPLDAREPLPCIPTPLAGQDPDVPLDLQIAAQRAYREGPYARAR